MVTNTIIGSLVRTVLLGYAIVVFKLDSRVVAQSKGWTASDEVITLRKHQRPGYVWREEDVPRYVLPDLLRTADGMLVTTTAQWMQRRREIFRLFQTTMYGIRPNRPQGLSFDIVEVDSTAMDGRGLMRRISINSTQEGREHRFELVLFLPRGAKMRVPVFLLLNNRGIENTDYARRHRTGFWPAEDVIARGYGIAAIQNSDLAADHQDSFRDGAITLFEGEQALERRSPDVWMTLAAWGWGASRVMDYLETDSLVDASRVAVLGHSRGGKAALWAGAEDERFALVIANDSGCGGASLSRRRYGETIGTINRNYPHWFTANFKAFNDKEAALPIDQHMLMALVAPRALYIASSDEDLWADPRGEFLSLAHSSPVYALWGHPTIPLDGMPPLDSPIHVGMRGYHIRSGGHDMTCTDWHYFMDFADYLWR